MMSPKEQWRQQITDYDILFIKSGWLVDKCNRLLPFVNQENRGRGEAGQNSPSPPPPPPPPPPPMTTKVKNTQWQIGLIASFALFSFVLNSQIMYLRKWKKFHDIFLLNTTNYSSAARNYCQIKAPCPWI